LDENLKTRKIGDFALYPIDIPEGEVKIRSFVKGISSYTHNQNMVKTTNIWFAGYFSDVEISPNTYEVH
jgi:hypothetical protein